MTGELIDDCMLLNIYIYNIIHGHIIMTHTFGGEANRFKVDLEVRLSWCFCKENTGTQAVVL